MKLEDIKILREKTGVGIMDCRKALDKAKGDFKKAEQILQKKSAMVAAKKANRVTKSGIIEAYIHNDARVGAMVKLSCETDFVARNTDFQKLAHELAMQIAAMNPKTVKDLLKQEYIRDSKLKIEDLIKAAIGKIKENIKVESFQRMEI